MDPEERDVECPACGGAGGGPLGRAGGAWDVEDYVCPRCKGRGALALADASPRPGLVKAAPAEGEAPAEKRKVSG
jgi:DnaJ-class molecular chaperone